MAHQQCQRFRFKTQVCTVPIDLINDEPFVFLENIQEKFRCNIQSFTVNNGPLGWVRNDRGDQVKPLRIRAIIDEIIDCDEPQRNDIDYRRDHLDEKLDKILENDELLMIETGALRRQTFELAEHTVPRHFIVIPEKTSKLNPANLFQHSYRLFFLCEEGDHFAFHEGYELNQPLEFIRKYAPYLKRMITAVRVAVGVGSIAVPSLGSLAPQISAAGFIRDVRFWDSLSGNLEKMDGVLREITNDDKVACLPDIHLEGADLREIESFLKRRDKNRALGNLYRSTTNTGSVRWVCIHHYNEFYSDKKKKELQQQFRSLGGIIRDDEIIIDKDGVENFDKMLNLINEGLCLFKLTLRRCEVRESAFDKMLVLINQRPYIQYLELFSVNVSHLVGFTATHRKVIGKLDRTLKKCTNLTIKYIVEWPEKKSAFDSDLFDYALEQSTERLILQVYTRDDGKKIVLQDLDKYTLQRIVRSLNQSKAISHCAINEFDGELSSILLNNTTITKLTIFLVRFDEQKVTALKQFLTKRTCLRELRCSTCQNLSPLITMLSQELANNVELQVLALSDISENHQVIELTTMLEKNNHLTELNLTLDIYVNVQTIIQISQALKTNKSLKKLKLTGVRGDVVHEGSNINLLELFFRKTSIEQLILHFQDGQSNIRLFRETIQAIENVEMLDLSHCNILSTKMFNGICPIIIGTSLLNLSLHSCKLSFEDAVDLFQGLTQNKTLTLLSLIDLRIQNNTNGQSFYIELANMIRLNTTLKKLTYSDGNLRDEGVEMIGKALENNQTLEELNISRNRIGDDGAIALAIALTNNNALLLLNIRKNNIKYDGIFSIFQSLRNNRTLRQLHISKSSYKDNLEQFNKVKEELLNSNELINIY